MANISNTGISASESGRRYPSNGVDYPLRFFNMMHFQRPKTLNEVFKWCIILNESHGLLDRITDTMARYPVTNCIVTGDIGENAFWATHLNEELCIQNELVQNGKDYYTFGNCIVSIVPPFKRYLVCPKCNSYKNHCINEDNSDDKVNWKFSNFQFIAKCRNKDCKYHGVMEVKDELLTGDEFVKNVKIQRWPIQNIKVRDLSIAGKKRIYYKIEDKYKKPILAGDKFVTANVPYTFILACKQHKSATIELPSGLTFHYKYESITEPEWEGLSKPFFFSAWKDIFMSFILRKAQECIASDHLIPNRFIFPTATPGGQDPLSKIDGSAWVSTVTTQLKRQQNDPNEIGVVPFPVGYQALGGQGKAMSLREEIELQDRRILTQMGIPPELIYGGMTWSGSNISLRMLENLFLYYIHSHNHFLKFYVNYVSRVANIKAPSKVLLSPFKMADDIQQMNALSALGAQGRISETTALSQVGHGINLQQEADQAEKDADNIKRILRSRQMITTEVTNEINKVNNMDNLQLQGAVANATPGIQQASQSQLVNGITSSTTQGIVNQINMVKDPGERRSLLMELQSKDPQKYNEIVAGLNGVTSVELPSAKPPRSNPKDAKI
jgi:hypothetical protein